MSVKVMGDVWSNSKAKGSALLLELAIADHANDQGMNAFPSVEHLAQKTRLSVRQTQRLIKELGSIKEIQVAKNAGPKGVNYYVVRTGKRT